MTSGVRFLTWWCMPEIWRSTDRGRPRWSIASGSLAGPVPVATLMSCCGPGWARSRPPSASIKVHQRAESVRPLELDAPTAEDEPAEGM